MAPAWLERGLHRYWAACRRGDASSTSRSGIGSGRVVAGDAGRWSVRWFPHRTAARRSLTAGPAPTSSSGRSIEAAGYGLPRYNLVEVILPIVDADGDALAVVAMWRDADALLASLDGARRDVIVVRSLPAFSSRGCVPGLPRRAGAAQQAAPPAAGGDAPRCPDRNVNHGTVVSTLADEVGIDHAAGAVIRSLSSTSTTSGSSTTPTPPRTRCCCAWPQSSGRGVGPGTPGGAVRPRRVLLVLAGASLDDAQRAAERVRSQFEAVSVRFGDSEELPISVSVGIAAFPQHATSVTDLLSSATVALSEAKAGGGDAVSVFQDGEEERVMSGPRHPPGAGHRGGHEHRYTKRHSRTSRATPSSSRAASASTTSCSTRSSWPGCP